MNKFYLVLLFIISFGNGFAQPTCIWLGCANSQTGILTYGTLQDSLINAGFACYNGNTVKQIFWQNFYSPAAGNFTQTYTPTSGVDMDINYEIFDEGTSHPTTFDCPFSTDGWTSVACDTRDHFNQPVGPGLFGITLATTAGHYYAIAIIIWRGISNGGSSSYTFDISKSQMDGIDFTSATWSGTVSTNFTDLTNWACDGVPEPDNDVIIPSGTPFLPILSNGGVQCRTLTLMPGAVLTIANEGELDVSDSVKLMSGAVLTTETNGIMKVLNQQ